MIVSYGFIPKNSGKTRGIGYEEEVFPTLGTDSGCGGGVAIVRQDESKDETDSLS